jgi:transposase
MHDTKLPFATLVPEAIGFLPGLAVIDQIDHGFSRVTLRTQPTTALAPCVDCGTPSRRVHGRYWRGLGDLACLGRPTLLLVRVRRFRCLDPACPRRTFAEPLPGIARPRARQTDRLRAAHHAIGLALGGDPGARHAAAMGVPISRTTLLDRVRAGHPGEAPPVRVLGVDDWAWRKGQRYGTILVDLERRRPVDLLPDRGADGLAAWLEAHPGVAVVVRDRAGAYAEGAARGAPEAIQVADRWHLLRNGSDALRGVLERHHRDLHEAARASVPPPEPAPLPQEVAAKADEPSPKTATEMRGRAAQERRDARFAEAARLREGGMPLAGIARALGVERQTVRRWLRAGHAPTWRHADRGRSILDPHRAHLEERWAAGCRNAAALWRELRARGFGGQARAVRTWATGRRRRDPPTVPGGVAPRPAPAKAMDPPTPRRAARLLTVEPDTLAEADRRLVEALLARSPAVAAAADLARRFSAMVKGRAAEALDPWLRDAEAGALANLAAGIRRDEDAVRAALTEAWSGGQVEGQVNRLKAIKRAMFGRAGFDLLRCRVLGRA